MPFAAGLEYDNLTPSINGSSLLGELKSLFEDERLASFKLDLENVNLNMKKSVSALEYKSGDTPLAPLSDDDEIYLRG